MPLSPSSIQAVLLDLGNTLIEFGPVQVTLQNDRLQAALESLYGPCDRARLEELRASQVVAPYRRECRENVPMEIVQEVVQVVMDREPTPDELDRLLAVREEAFLESVTIPDGVIPLLERLRRQRPLALISNYPSGRCIRRGLEKTGLDRVLDSVVVSGDLGLVKPHPLPFQTALAELGLSPANCVHVGDNWLADVQGAGRMGMQTVHITQFVPYERFEPQPGDRPADAVITRLAELEELLPS